MNNLTQAASLLVGSIEEITKLESKENAKILVISDSHGNYNALINAVRVKGSECDALLFTGDGVCDIGELFNKAMEDKDLMEKLPSVVGFVQGNGDNASFSAKNLCRQENEPYFLRYEVPLLQTIKICNHNFMFAHGHKLRVYYGYEEMEEKCKMYECDGAFYGHTHFAKAEISPKGRLFLNPGSICSPRGGQEPCFATVEIKKSSREFDYCWWTLSDGICKLYNPESTHFFF